MRSLPDRTEVFDSYWRFANERLAVYYRRLINPIGPWTEDSVLATHRFTNTYRAADRVSQYLIREVQYSNERSQAPSEVFFRTILFKIFNKIETWEEIESEFGPISWQSIDLDKLDNFLDRMIVSGRRIYSAAYIMPAPAFGKKRKHSNHIMLLNSMMNDGLPGMISKADSLESAYREILSYPGLGPFLAFQYTVDLNYSSLLNFDEDDFVVAGPGALDGISKCFRRMGGVQPAFLIREIVDRQEDEFKALGIDFQGLFGRRLKLIDCQNLFCEISKYARVAHPNILGVSRRTRIKQKYGVTKMRPSIQPFFPPKWGLEYIIPQSIERRSCQIKGQLTLI